jgi:hypothetical protein
MMRAPRALVLAIAALALVACNFERSPEDGRAVEAPADGIVLIGDAPTWEEVAPVFIGTWAVTASQCALPQESENAPYIFTADGFDQHEAHCDFSSIVPMTENEFRVGATCTVEGDEQRTAFDLTRAGDTLRIADGELLTRCS